MKKSILASSIAAAVFGLGAAGVAQAANDSHVLFVPYFTAQDANMTLLNLVNTDTANGKAVKVRFRGAANSDDVFDFQLFLSPGDVWTANVSKGATGAAKLTTADSSCTKPAASVLNATPFLTNRLDQALTGDALANGTREGYIEILNMADVPSAGTSNIVSPVTVNPLFTAIKHVKNTAGASVPPCSGTSWTALDTTAPLTGTTTSDGSAAASAKGLTAPTGGLMANWTIINTVGAAAWSGQAQNLSYTGTTKVTYFPQTAATVSGLSDYTADPLFLASGTTGNTAGKYSLTTLAMVASGDVLPVITAGSYDLPDLSTPLTVDATTKFVNTTPDAQAAALSAALSATSITNEFLTDSSIGATTDWVFSMPTRRYAVAMAYTKVAATDDGRRFNNNNGLMFNSTTTGVNGKQICVKGVSITPTDREENTVTSTTDVVISPSTPVAGDLFCGEASVLSFNNGTMATSGSLKASVAVKNVEVGYNSGWTKITLPTTGLPVLGSAFVRALGNGTQTFGATYDHRRL